MKRFYIIGFLILMSFDTLSQISFKYASTQALPLELSPDWLMRLFLNPWLYGAIAGYLGAFVTWMTPQRVQGIVDGRGLFGGAVVRGFAP